MMDPFFSCLFVLFLFGCFFSPHWANLTLKFGTKPQQRCAQMKSVYKKTAYSAEQCLIGLSFSGKAD